MRLRIKIMDNKNKIKIDTKTQLKEIMVNEEFLHPQKESIALCFRDGNNSGIVEITPSEFERLYYELKQRAHLIKAFKKTPPQGAIRF